MNNEDLKKITSIKQYLLDPPVSFKLKDYAINYFDEAIDILKNYPAAKDVIALFEEKKQALKTNILEQSELMKLLREAGISLSNLTNR